MEEIALLDRCIKEDKSAWDRFFDSYSNVIYSSIRRTLNGSGYGDNINNIIDDLFNSTILKLIEDDCRRLKKYSRDKENYSFQNWLYKVTNNIVVDFFRKERSVLSLNQRYRQYMTYCVERDGDPEKRVICREILSEMFEQLTGAKAGERLIMELLYIEGLSTEQVARIMQTSPGNIRTIVYRARKKIRKKFYEQE